MHRACILWTLSKVNVGQSRVWRRGQSSDYVVAQLVIPIASKVSRQVALRFQLCLGAGLIALGRRQS